MLKTQRLILRNWKNTDVDPFFEINSDPKVMEFFPCILTKKESDILAKQIMDELKDKGYGFWAVELISEANFIGFIGLHYQDFKAHFTPCVEIGWRLHHKFWGYGFAFEGAKKALEFGFNEVDLNEIVSFTSKKNLRSIKLMNRLQMSHNPEDDFKNPKLPTGHPLQKHVLFRLSKIQFNKENFLKF